MTLRLNGSTSGYTEIDAPAVAGSNTLVLPTGNGSADQALVTNGSGTLSFADRGRIVQGTAQNSTSGTSIDFTSIPSWVKRVTVMFAGVSTSGTSAILVQLGTGSTTYTTSGYSGQANSVGSISSMSAGFIASSNVLAANLYSGIITLCGLGSNIWSESGTLNPNSASINGTFSGGSVTLAATLTAVRITTVNGTDTFDAGSINILYEG